MTTATTSREFGKAVGRFVGGILWILGVCWFLQHCVGNPLDELAFIRRAQVAPGFIIDTSEDVEDGDEGGVHWFHEATYTYRTPDGRDFTRSTGSRSGRLREELRELSRPYPVEIEYLPDDPTVGRIKGDGCQSVVEWLWRKVLLGGSLLTGLSWFGVVLMRDAIRDMKRILAGESALPYDRNA